MARIAIVGVGAIGGAVAGLLEMAGALGDSLGEEILAYYRGAPPDAVNSLFADRLAGRLHGNRRTQRRHRAQRGEARHPDPIEQHGCHAAGGSATWPRER